MHVQVMVYKDYAYLTDSFSKTVEQTGFVHKNRPLAETLEVACTLVTLSVCSLQTFGGEKLHTSVHSRMRLYSINLL